MTRCDEMARRDGLRGAFARHAVIPSLWLLGALASMLPLVGVGCGASRPAVDRQSTVEYVPVGEATTGSPWRGAVTSRCRQFEPLIREVATEHGIDAGLVAGIVQIESGFRPRAVSRAGARGLMQVMPGVGRRLGCGDLFDPRRNLRCGVVVLKRFLERYDHRLVFGLSAYNAGFKVPNAALAANTLPSNYRYVEKVLAARSIYLAHGCGR